MKPRRALLVASAALLALGLGLGSSASALAASPSPSPSPSSSSTGGKPTATVTYGLGPSTKGKLDRRTGYTLLTTRGGTVKDEVGIVNLSTKPLTLNIYAADALNAPDGEFGLQPAAAEVTDSAAWVVFQTPTGKGYVKLKPKQTVYVPFSVTVPKDAPVGDHVAGIVVSTVATGETPGERTSQVTLEQRVALKMALRVAGQLNPTLAIENLQASYAGSLNPLAAGTATVTYTVRNTGNVRLGAAQKVTVGGITGSTSVDSLPDIPILLPGGSATVTVPVPDARPAGILTATVDVTPLTLPGDANPSIEPVSASTRVAAVPWLLVGVLAAIVLAVVAWMRMRTPPAPVRGARERQPERVS